MCVRRIATVSSISSTAIGVNIAVFSAVSKWAWSKKVCNGLHLYAISQALLVVRSGSLQGRRGRLPSKTKAASHESGSRVGDERQAPITMQKSSGGQFAAVVVGRIDDARLSRLGTYRAGACQHNGELLNECSLSG